MSMNERAENMRKRLTGTLSYRKYLVEANADMGWKYGGSPWHQPYLATKKPLWAPEIHYLKGTFWLTYSLPGWKAGDHDAVQVEFYANVKVVNPGSIVEYAVKLIPPK